MSTRSSSLTSSDVSDSLLQEVKQGTERDFFSTGSVERMTMIPSPSQAMTIIRALNMVDLKDYNLDALEILLPLLKELLSGKISIYKSLPDKTFIELNNIVHDALEKTSMRQLHKSYNPHTENRENNDILVEKSHLMTVLRAINSIDFNQLDEQAKNRMNRVKQLVFSLSLGRKSSIEQLLQSKNNEDKICARIIRNALIMAYDEDVKLSK